MPSSCTTRRRSTSIRDSYVNTCPGRGALAGTPRGLSRTGRVTNVAEMELFPALDVVPTAQGRELRCVDGSDPGTEVTTEVNECESR